MKTSDYVRAALTVSSRAQRIRHDLLGGEVMLPRQLLGIVAVVELLREAVAVHADVLVHAVVCGVFCPKPPSSVPSRG